MSYDRESRTIRFKLPMKYTDHFDGVLFDIDGEAERAEKKYGLFSSTHEGYGVLAEEVAELLDAIRANDAEQIRIEATQVAAVAARIAACTFDEPCRRRSNLT